MICSDRDGKSKITRQRQGADRRPCFCTAFGRVSFYCRMVTACMTVVSRKDNESK